MGKVNQQLFLKEDPPTRFVFIPTDPYVEGCETGWRYPLADNEIVCPDCKDHPCVDEFFEVWCRRCNANGYIKIGSEEL